MNFPNFTNKYKHAGLFSPQDFYRQYPKPDIELPQKFILIYDAALFKRITGKYSPTRLPGGISGANLYQTDKIGIAFIKGIGAPHAAAVLEELICLGGRIFLNIGTAGGLKTRGNFLCSKALRDEGTSYHYLKPQKYSYPDQNLTDKMAHILNKSDYKYQKAATWTTDAPYRETAEEVDHYRQAEICTVDMEAAALFAVAEFRKVSLAAAFTVSDILGETWEPGFHYQTTKQGLDQIFSAALTCLKEIDDET